MPSLSSVWNSTVRVFQKDIWLPAYLDDRSFRGRSYAILRVLSITLTGLRSTRVVSRAAALSFHTLLGLGPLIGLAVLIAGFAMGEGDPKFVTKKLNELIKFVAPQITRLEEGAAAVAAENAAAVEPTPPATNPTASGKNAAKTPPPKDAKKSSQPVPPANPPPTSVPAATSAIEVNTQLVDFLDTIIRGTRSSAGGVVSIVSLIMIVLLLFTQIEEVFNDIWGVRSGRAWITRIVFYWTILSLGAVLFFGAVGALSAATYLSYFKENLKFGGEIAHALTIALPVFSITLVILLLTLFYRYIPNTHVYWKAALIGAIVTTLMLVVNNTLTAAYFSRVDLARSIYGSLALIPIMMFGLYMFWLFVLIGGQLSYAVQNIHFRNSQVAWANLTESTRERLTLIVLLTIGRRFQACLPPCTVSQLASSIKVPTQILNEALNRLVDLKLVTPVPPGPHDAAADYFYQPARPLNRITLGEFKHLFENHGEDPAGEVIDRLDPLIGRYHDSIRALAHQDLFTKSLEELFSQHQFDESQPPFTLGHPATKTA